VPHICFSYCVPAAQCDINRIRRRVQKSLPEWEISDALQIVSSALGAKYASYRCVSLCQKRTVFLGFMNKCNYCRHLRAQQRNGDPNERELFHFCPESVIAKIWQEVTRAECCNFQSFCAVKRLSMLVSYVF
jgi:hypothetical protein